MKATNVHLPSSSPWKVSSAPGWKASWPCFSRPIILQHLEPGSAVSQINADKNPESGSMEASGEEPDVLRLTL